MRFHLLLLASLLLLPSAALADPFAPVPTLPSGYDDPLYAGIVGEMKQDMPEAAAVPAPRCTSCVALQLWPGMEGSLASIQLLSPDSPEKVLAFYQAKLSEWEHVHEYGFQWVFWKGTPIQKNSRQPTVPHVVIHAATTASLDQKLFSKMKTQITVFYALKSETKKKAPESEEE